MASPIILTDVDQLRKLAKLIYNQESDSIKGIKFNSEPELSQYLRDCQANYKSVIGHLDKGVELKRKYENDQTRSPIANDIFLYIVYCSNSALQTVRNYTVRKSYLEKISEHIKELIKEVEEVDTGNVQCLAEEVKQYKEAMLESVNKYRSNASNNFSESLKEKGMSFDELVQRHMSIWGLGGTFKYLKDNDKIKVYNDIIKTSGRGSIMEKLSAIKGVGGIAVVLFTAGLMVWDIFSSAHVLQTATHDTVVSIAAAGGALAGDFIGTVLATGLLGVEATSTFVVMAGFVTGIAGAFAIGAIAGLLIDLVIGSGGSAPLSTVGHSCYVTPLPDGQVLARQIAHQQN